MLTRAMETYSHPSLEVFEFHFIGPELHCPLRPGFTIICLSIIRSSEAQAHLLKVRGVRGLAERQPLRGSSPFSSAEVNIGKSGAAASE